MRQKTISWNERMKHKFESFRESFMTTFFIQRIITFMTTFKEHLKQIHLWVLKNHTSLITIKFPILNIYNIAKNL